MGAVFLPLNTAYTPAEVEYFVTRFRREAVLICDGGSQRGARAGRRRAPARGC